MSMKIDFDFHQSASTITLRYRSAHATNKLRNEQTQSSLSQTIDFPTQNLFVSIIKKKSNLFPVFESGMKGDVRTRVSYRSEIKNLD